MDKAEFDKFADEYRSLLASSVGITGEGPEYFAEYKVAALRSFCESRSLTDGVRTILDFGAGTGTSVPYFRKHFPQAQLTCVDVSERSLEVGEERFPGLARFQHFNGKDLPFGAASLDIAFAACVFHHIDGDQHVALFEELKRVIRPGGLIVVFEHNPLNFLTVRAVNQCPFDENAVLIPARELQRTLSRLGFSSVDVSYRLFFPRFLSALRPLERWLQWCPLGAQYSAIATV